MGRRFLPKFDLCFLLKEPHLRLLMTWRIKVHGPSRTYSKLPCKEIFFLFRFPSSLLCHRLSSPKKAWALFNTAKRLSSRPTIKMSVKGLFYFFVEIGFQLKKGSLLEDVALDRHQWVIPEACSQVLLAPDLSHPERRWHVKVFWAAASRNSRIIK